MGEQICKEYETRKIKEQKKAKEERARKAHLEVFLDTEHGEQGDIL